MISPLKVKTDDVFSPQNRGALIKYLIPIVALSITVLLVPLTMMPLWQSLQVLKAQKTQDIELLGRLNKKREQIAQVRNDIGTYRDQFTSLDTSYPTTKDVTALVLGISKLVGENGLTLESYRLNPGELIATPGAQVATAAASSSGSAVPQAPTPPPIVASAANVVNPEDALLFEVVTKGQLANQRDFIKKVSQIRRVLFISSISLSFKNDTYTTKTTIEVPYNGLPATLLAAEEPLPTLSEQAREMIASLEALPLYTNPF